MMSGLMTMCRVVIAITPGSPKNRSLATYLLPVKVREVAEPCLQLTPGTRYGTAPSSRH